MKTSRGMTLLELMAAVVITTLVVAMSLTVVTTGTRMARQTEQSIESNEAARSAMEVLMRDLRHAGTGAPGGIWALLGGTPTRINPIFSGSAGGGSGTDELWLVVPRQNVMTSQCVQGAAVTVTASGPGTLNVSCTAPAIATTDTIMVTNYTTAALLTGLSFPTATTISYAESGSLTNAPEKGAFQAGDHAFAVDIIHYRIGTLNGRPTLTRTRGTLGPSATVPFVDTTQGLGTYTDVEDLQVAFGVGTTFVHSLGAAFNPAARPTSVRVSVVGRTGAALRDDKGGLLPFRPLNLENRAPSPVVDGFRRSVYRRRVELVNMNVVAL